VNHGNERANRSRRQGEDEEEKEEEEVVVEVVVEEKNEGNLHPGIINHE
jgi:hypothetical protein